MRLPPRPNAMKLLSFLITPYKYTLYLDGDIAPCVGFQNFIFKNLLLNDILSTPNTFGYESTNGEKTYPASPKHPKFPSFPEINGGVFGYVWNERTRDLFIRAIELIPHFASIGFDQDQAMIRHALFESILFKNVKVYKGLMVNYCRFGWNCNRNNCNHCHVIHQRLCTGIYLKYISKISI